MFRRRKPPVRFPRYPLQWPRTAAWALGLVAGLAALLALAFLFAQPPLGEGWGPLGEIGATLQRPGPAIAFAVAALTWMAFCFRHVWLDVVALGPGRIEVGTFAAGSALEDADVAQLTLTFRHRLGELHLHAPASAPGQPADADFLDVLGQSGVDSRNWLGSALGLLRAAKPRHAWQIHGVLVRREQRPRFGLSVQVIRLPGRANPPETAWANSWDEAVRLGADYVTAAILPRTRRCTNQWSGWRRYRMGGRLLGNYEDAVEFEAARRYDEALDAYYLAVDDDPMNMALRLRIGLLQERMGMYLDAFATYLGIVEVATERAETRRTREPRSARRERKRAAIVARYRGIVLMGGAEFAEQWRQGGAEQGPERERHLRRVTLRARLRAPLVELTGSASSADRIGKLTPRQACCEPGSQTERDLNLAPGKLEFELRELLGRAALSAAGELIHELRFQAPHRRFELSLQSVRLTELCVRGRLARVREELKPGGADGWPPTIEQLASDLASIERNTEFNRWHEYYNAACVYALPLMAESETGRQLDAAGRTDFARTAVEWLMRALTSADSAYIAGQRDWLLSEDPDLDGLRPHPFFKDFEAMYFPQKGATPRRPRHAQTLESSRYVKALLEKTARWWEDAWHERGRRVDANPDVHELLEWWNDECEAWARVRDVALNNRHWQTRVALLNDIQEHADAYGLAPPSVGFPHYADDPLPELDETAEKPLDAKTVAAKWEAHFHEIGRAIPNPSPEGPRGERIARIDLWQDALRGLDTRGRSPRRFLLSALCDEHAALWQLLREWVTAEEDGERDAKRNAFAAQMRRTKRVCRGAAVWWRRPELLPVVTQRTATPVLIVRRGASNSRKPTPVA
jgi:hypothetical protein